MTQGRLEVWETPVGSVSWPSVWVYTTHVLKDSVEFVRTSQLFRIEFENILGLKLGDESNDNTRFHVDGNRNDGCSYTWRDSTWLKEFNVEHEQSVEESVLNHYVLLGGDYNNAWKEVD